ncbi:hypothetical protein NM688_g2065 [Phlebia brevispora]|uniref:Uncharacterized protein n=1 Tax=Phlebia brevispora TaxID=194682 RepID=A0ACC1T9R0_9APHY|nr:hypothetical protein NM688_g2065 [Phlebia brevispora]
MAYASPSSPSSRLRAELTPGQGSAQFQGRIPRPPPVEKRESVLRASILDTALELGIGSSSTVANWIFNPVAEGDEETEVRLTFPFPRHASSSVLCQHDGTSPPAQNLLKDSPLSSSSPPSTSLTEFPQDTCSPSLTYASTATSEDSLSPARLAAAGLNKSLTGDSIGSVQKSSLSSLPQRAIHFDLSASPVPSAQEQSLPQSSKQWHRKLRKPKPKTDGTDGNANGYESDGGYISEGGKNEKEGKKKKKTKEKEGKEKEKKHPKVATDREDESDGGYLSDILHKRRNKKAKAARAAKLADANAALTDYDTDGGHMHAHTLARSKKDKK